MDFYGVDCRPKVLERDGPTLFILQMTCIVVAQKLRCLEDFGFEWYYIETVYWLPKETVWILCTIVEHPMTVSMSLRWAQRWASTERQRSSALHHGESISFRCNVHSKSYDSPPFDSNMVATTSQLWAKNERQRSVNEVWLCILENARAVRRH